MNAPRPHSVADLALAPVLLKLEENLRGMRRSSDLRLHLALELNDDELAYQSPEVRASRLRDAAVQTVDLHGWVVTPTPDLYGLSVSHGDYEVCLMFGERLTHYVKHGQGT